MLVFALCSQTLSQSIGDRLIRTYTDYVILPLNTSSAHSTGWLSSPTCNPKLGFAWNYRSTKPSVDYPLTIYFTPNGYPSGIAVEVFGSVDSNLLQKGFFKQIAPGQWRISLTFRPSEEVCGKTASPISIGDRIVVNADTIAYSIPTTESTAINQKWHKGSCFYGMGHHYFYDLVTAPMMSWNSSNLLPVVTMYDKGQINAIFIASSTVQQGFSGAHWWEPVPLVNYLMCKNTCDGDCTFSGTTAWSTFHVYFKQYTQVTCANDCSTACCP